MIDKATKEIKQDDEQTVYKSLDEISDDLPDHSPRFVLLSYPMTLVSHGLQVSLLGRDARADTCFSAGIRPSVRSLCPPILPSCHMQQ